MLNEIRGSDIRRTLALGLLVLGLFGLFSYVCDLFSTPYRDAIVAGLIAFLVLGAVFDTVSLNAERARIQSSTYDPAAFERLEERQILRGRATARYSFFLALIFLFIQIATLLQHVGRWQGPITAADLDQSARISFWGFAAAVIVVIAATTSERSVWKILLFVAGGFFVILSVFGLYLVVGMQL